MSKVLNEGLRSQINDKTEDYFRATWERNARINVHGKYKKINNVEFTPKPLTLICGSGPSLEMHIDFIKKYRDKLLIFAADTTFAILYKHEIYPDFVCNIDSSDSLEACFVFKDYAIRLRNTKMVAATVSSPLVLQAFQGTKYLFNLGAELETLRKVRLMFPTYPTIESKYNVGEFMLNLAIKYFLSRNVAITGLDFAYVGDKYYSGGCPMPDATRKEIYLYDSDMNLCATDTMFLTYMIELFNNYQDEYHKKAQIFNLSKGVLPLKYRLNECVEFLDNISLQKPNISL